MKEAITTLVYCPDCDIYQVQKCNCKPPEEKKLNLPENAKGLDNLKYFLQS